MEINESVDAFLLEYAKSLEWQETNIDVITRRLCEEYFYPSDNFLMIFYGWLWGKLDDDIKANCGSSRMKLKMDEMYKIVAKENHWED